MQPAPSWPDLCQIGHVLYFNNLCPVLPDQPVNVFLRHDHLQLRAGIRILLRDDLPERPHLRGQPVPVERNPERHRHQILLQRLRDPVLQLLEPRPGLCGDHHRAGEGRPRIRDIALVHGLDPLRIRRAELLQHLLHGVVLRRHLPARAVVDDHQHVRQISEIKLFSISSIKPLEYLFIVVVMLLIEFL